MQTIMLTNSYDEENVNRGQIAADQVRSTVVEALVDTGATMMVLPADAVAPCLIRALIRFMLPELLGPVWECAAGDGLPRRRFAASRAQRACDRSGSTGPGHRAARFRP